MIVDVPEYNTWVEFPDETPKEKIERVLKTNFPTKTAPFTGEKEKKFLEWYQGWAAFTGIDPNPDHPKHKYDYRAAYLAGQSPKFIPEYNEYHWPDEFKLPGHPTYPQKRSVMKDIARGFLEGVRGGIGTVETMLSLGTGALLGFPAGATSTILRQLITWPQRGFRFQKSPAGIPLPIPEIDWVEFEKEFERTSSLFIYAPLTEGGKQLTEHLAQPFNLPNIWANKYSDKKKITNPQERAFNRVVANAITIMIPFLGKRLGKLGIARLKRLKEYMSRGDLHEATRVMDNIAKDEPEKFEETLKDIESITREEAEAKTGKIRKRLRKEVAEPPIPEETEVPPLRTPEERQRYIERIMPKPLEETLARKAAINQRRINELFPSVMEDATVEAEARRFLETTSALERTGRPEFTDIFDRLLAEVDATVAAAKSAGESLYRDYLVLRQANIKADKLLERAKKIAEPPEKRAGVLQVPTVEFVPKDVTLEFVPKDVAVEFPDLSTRLTAILSKKGFERTAEDLLWLKHVMTRESPFIERLPSETKIEIVSAIEGKPPPVAKPMSLAEKMSLLDAARRLGISRKGKIFEQLRAEIEAARIPAETPLPKGKRDEVVMSYLQRRYGAQAEEMFARLTERGKERVYKEALLERPEPIVEEIKTASSLDELIEREDKLGERNIGLAEETGYRSKSVSPDRVIIDADSRWFDFHRNIGERRVPSTHYLSFLVEHPFANPVHKEFAKIILNDPELRAEAEKISFTHRLADSEHSYGSYFSNINHIYADIAKYSSLDDLGYIVTHEINHGLTVRAIRYNPEFALEVEKLLNEARAKLPEAERRIVESVYDEASSFNKSPYDLLMKRLFELDELSQYPEIYYGLINPYEFLSEAVSDRRFQSFLKNIRPKGAAGPLGLLRSLAEAIMKHVFKGKVPLNLLENVLNLNEKIMKYQARELPWGKQILEEARPHEIPSILRSTKKKVSEKGFSHLDEELFKDATDVGSYFYRQGFKDYTKWKEKMTSEIGEEITPYLELIWGQMHFNRTVGELARNTLRQFGNTEKIIKGGVTKVEGIEIPQVAITEAEGNLIEHVVNKGKDLEVPDALVLWANKIPGIGGLFPKELIATMHRNFRIFDEANDTNYAFSRLFHRPVQIASRVALAYVDAYRKGAKDIRKSYGLKANDVLQVGAYAIKKQLEATNDTAAIKALEEQMEKRGLTIPDELTPGQQAYYDYHRDIFDVSFDKVNEARAAAGRPPIGYVKDYTTFMRIVPEAILEERNFILEPSSTINEYIKRKTPYLKYEEKRVFGSEYKFKLNLEEITPRYLDSIIRYTYTAPTIARAREWLKLPVQTASGATTLREALPKFASAFEEWLNYHAGQRVGILRMPLKYIGVEKGIQRISRMISTSTLGINLRIAMIQPTAILSTFTELGLHWTARGLAGLMSSREVEMARAKSKVLRTRYNEAAVADNMADIMFRHIDTPGIRGKFNAIWNAYEEKSFLPISLLDSASATATWIGAYKKYKAERPGVSDSLATEYADRVVIDTQASTLSSDIAPIQYSPIGKALTLFQSWAINNWDWIVRDVFGSKNPKIHRKERAIKLMRFFIGINLINALFEDILGIGSPFPNPVGSAVRKYKETDSEIQALLDAVAETLTILPGPAGALRYGSDIYGATFNAVSDLIKSLHREINAKEVIIEPVIRSAARLTGLPGVYQMTQIIKRRKRGASWPEAILGPVDPMQRRKEGIVVGAE